MMSSQAHVRERARMSAGRIPIGVRLLVGVAVWIGAYAANRPWWDWFFGQVWGLDLDSRLGSSVHFFFYDTTKILLLLSGLMFTIGLARASLNLEKARAYLERRGLGVGLMLAVVLGVVTPFCSCSSIPLFIGFVAAGVPIAITLTFLIASPLVSETAAILIGTQFGWHIAAAYVAAGSVIAVAIGFIFAMIDRRFDLSRWVEPFVLQTKSPIAALQDGDKPTLEQRVRAGIDESSDIFKRVWKWVILGVAIGAGIHGWIPEDFFARFAGADNPFAVPIATLAGIPLYANGGGVVPIGEALWAKGLPLGTVMSLMMGAIALSVPEAVMLRQVLKPKLLAMFFLSVAVGIIIVGYLFNFIYV